MHCWVGSFDAALSKLRLCRLAIQVSVQKEIQSSSITLHYYQLSSSAGFRSSCNPSNPVHLFLILFGGGGLWYPVLKWLLFLH